MASLRTSCELLSRLSASPGNELRSEWYRRRLRALWESGALFKYETADDGFFEKRKGVGADELSLLDRVPCDGLRDVELGGDGGARRVPSGLLEGGDGASARGPCFEGDRFPLEQALGGVVYLKRDILPFHCDIRLGISKGNNRRRCYVTDGPCRHCQRDGFPIPTHKFPTWAPLLAVPGAGVTAPHSQMDVLYSTNAVSPTLHAQIAASLDALARRRATSPMPQYLNIIDPNVNAVDGVWVPTEFDVRERRTASLDLVVGIELACVAATGKRLPFGFGPLIASLASDGGEVRAAVTLASPIPDLDAHSHVKLNVATQRLMEAAVPLLARLRRPALLLPGPLQAVVKAQRIVLAPGEEYAGVWHEDGMEEHVVAVVLYYYRVSPTLRGGQLEFCSKQRHALGIADAASEEFDLESTRGFAESLPRCRVPVKEGTLVCFSNYAAVHRVLRMEAAASAQAGGGSRDFVALFVIDQRHPLPAPPAVLPPSDQRVEAARKLLHAQLQPRGVFGLDSSSVYSTGNGAVADVGWLNDGGDGGGYVGEVNPDAATLIQRLNLAPPAIERGVSMVLAAPPPPPEALVEYCSESGWAEAWVGEGEDASVVYLDLTWGSGMRAEPPEEGVSSVLTFPAGFAQFGAYVEEQGHWVEDDPALDARIRGEAIELVLQSHGQSYFLCREQLQCVRRLSGLAEGSRCELETFLEAAEAASDDADSDEDAAPPRGKQTDKQHEDGFDPNTWPAVLAYLKNPEQPLRPLAEFLNAQRPYRQHMRRRCISELIGLQLSAQALRCRALVKAAEAARKQIDQLSKD